MPDRAPFKPRNSLSRPNPSSQPTLSRPTSSPQWRGQSNGIKRKRTPPPQDRASTSSNFLSGEQKSRGLPAHKLQPSSPQSPSKGASRFKNLIRPSPKTSPRKEEDINAKTRYRSPIYQTPITKDGSRHATSSTKPKTMQASRKGLPIWGHQEDIERALKERDVLILVGETGSGKSTQVPQFLLSQAWCKTRRVRTLVKEDSPIREVEVGGCIAVTEPRRVAAISLAHRVASEMDEILGQGSTPGRVGYSVRFDSKVSSNTRIKFLTEGMLLQELLRDPWLKQYSAVIVDEIHERGVNVDLVVGFLKNIISGKKEGRGGIPLKVAVMSATADMEGLQRFFNSPPASKSPYIDHVSAQNSQNGAQRLVNGSISDLPIRHELNRSVLLTNGYHMDNNQEGSDDLEDSASWSGISSSDDANEDPTAQKVYKTPSSFSKDRGASLNPFSSTQINAKDEQTGSNGYLKSPFHKTNGTIPSDSHQFAKKSGGSKFDIADLQSKSENTLKNSTVVSTLYIEGRQYPVKVLYAEEPVHDFVDAALRTIFQIHYGESLPGDILVFLTGQDDIESLDKLVNEYAAAMGPEVPKIFSIPLFAALSNVAQQKIFQPTPPKTRKIIIATNVAETSITVPGVRYVIDCGKAKIKQFRARIGLDSLLIKPVSKSAAIQRKGRAGREGPGTCYRLYTEKEYLNLEETNTPEVLRCNVAEPILTIKARGVDDILSFPFLDSPSQDALRSSLLQLLRLGALTETGHISTLGTSMAKLPLSPMLGRVLLAASHPSKDCVEEAIDIISCLSVDNNIFLPLTSEEKRDEAETARKELNRREGDHITLLKTVQCYLAEETNRRVWAEEHFVSHRALQAVMDIRKQLRSHCQNNKILKSPAELDYVKELDPERANLILQCFVEAYSSHTARIMPDGSYKTLIGNQTVAIHPSSVLFGRKFEAIMYHEYIYTTKSYAKNVSAVQLVWVDEVMARDVAQS